MRFVASTFLFAALLVPATVRADGLIYKLPKDGASVSYKLDISMTGADGQARKSKGSMILRSVGKASRDGRKCRWIEFNMKVDDGGQTHDYLAKLLIPEKELGKGRSPIDHVKACWLKMGSEAVQVDDPKGSRGGPLPVLLIGPDKSEKKLPAKTISCGVGKLKCAGLQAVKKFKQGEQEMAAEITTRLNDKVPFGVVFQQIKLTVSPNGAKQTVVLKFTADTVGTGAKSGLPDKS